MPVPYMPLYIADYQADTAHLTTVEHGAYLLLIMTYWQRGGPLPADDKKLARICKVSTGQWARIKDTILDFFEAQNGDAGKQLCHSRIDGELSKLRDKSLKKQKGGLARAQQMQSERSARGQLIVGVGVGSVAKATAADAPFDPVKVMFDSGVELLTAAGKSEAQARTWLGKARSAHGPEAVITAIGRAKREGAVDPIPFMEVALRANGRTRSEFEFTSPC